MSIKCELVFVTFSRLFKPHFGASAVTRYKELRFWTAWWSPTAVTISYRLLWVITWASASSLKALTRESSFSFSNAHWEKRKRGRDSYSLCGEIQYTGMLGRCAVTPETSVKWISVQRKEVFYFVWKKTDKWERPQRAPAGGFGEGSAFKL